MMGYQTRALPGSGTWMTGRGIRNRITEWYLFVEKKKMQIIPPEKIRDYLKAAEEWGVLPMFYLELSTGLRRGELVALLWSNLNLQTKTLTVAKSVSRG